VSQNALISEQSDGGVLCHYRTAIPVTSTFFCRRFQRCST
jgi:hypothetical protein